MTSRLHQVSSPSWTVSAESEDQVNSPQHEVGQRMSPPFAQNLPCVHQSHSLTKDLQNVTTCLFENVRRISRGRMRILNTNVLPCVFNHLSRVMRLHITTARDNEELDARRPHRQRREIRGHPSTEMETTPSPTDDFDLWSDCGYVKLRGSNISK